MSDRQNFGVVKNASDERWKLLVYASTRRGTGTESVGARVDIKAVLDHLVFDDNIRPMVLQALLDYELWLATQDRPIKFRIREDES